MMIEMITVLNTKPLKDSDRMLNDEMLSKT